jgi:hypothetical protein
MSRELSIVSPKSPLSSGYHEWTPKVWNLQPVRGDINGSKLNRPPSEFFSDYPAYLKEYDFMPSDAPGHAIWRDENAQRFISQRKNLMLDFLRERYGLVISGT